MRTLIQRHIPLAFIGVLGAGFFASPAALAAGATGESQRCIPLRQIDESPIIDDRTILVKMRGNGGFKRMDLAGGCSGISWQGYARKSPESAICTSDTLHVIGPVRTICKISNIVNIDAAEARALSDKKR